MPSECWANKITYRLQRFVTVRRLGCQPTRNVITKHLFCSSFRVCLRRHKVMRRGIPPRTEKNLPSHFKRVSVARSWLEGVAVFAQFKKTKVSHKWIGWQRSLERFNITKAIWQPKGRPQLPNFLPKTSLSRQQINRNREIYLHFSSTRLHPIFVHCLGKAECLRNSRVGNNWNIKFHYPSMERWNWMEDDSGCSSWWGRQGVILRI